MAIRQRQIRFKMNQTLAALLAIASTKEAGEQAYAADAKRDYVTDGTKWTQIRGVRVINAGYLDLVAAEPAAPVVGDAYIVKVTGTSSVTAVAVVAEQVVEWDGAAWTVLVPTSGDVAVAANSALRFDGTTWVQIGATHVTKQLVPTAQNTVPALTSLPADALDVFLEVNGVSEWSGKVGTPAFTVNATTGAIVWSAANAGYTIETSDTVIAFYLGA